MSNHLLRRGGCATEADKSPLSWKQITPRASATRYANQMNKPRGKEVQRLKKRFHNYEKNTFCTDNAGFDLAGYPTGEGS